MTLSNDSLANPDKKWQWWLVIITAAIQAQVLFFGFTYLDDNTLLLDYFGFFNKPVRIFQAFTHDFLSPVSGGFYFRPLFGVTLVINALLGGQNLFLYHLTDLAIHVLVVVLFFRLLLRLGYRAKASFAGALVFAIHPVVLQTIGWIPARNDSLAALFILGSLIAILKFYENSRARFLFLHFLLFALALLSKEVAIATPILVLFLQRTAYKIKLFSLGTASLLFSWGVLIFGWWLLRSRALAGSGSYTVTDGLISVFHGLPSAIVAVGKVFLPFNLSTYPVLDDTSLYYGFAAIVLLAALLLFSRKKHLAMIIFGFLWFLAFFLPGLVRPSGSGNPELLEHRIYLPALGLLIVLLQTDLFKRYIFAYRNLRILAICLAVLLGLGSLIYGSNFYSRERYWAKAVKASPHSSFARKQLGAMHHLNGNTELAKEQYRKAIELNPSETLVHGNLGLIYADEGLIAEAEIAYRIELALNPNYDKAHFNLGVLLHNQGRKIEAATEWEKALQINPNSLDSYRLLAIYYLAEDNRPQAAKHYLNYLARGGTPIAELNILLR